MRYQQKVETIKTFILFQMAFLIIKNVNQLLKNKLFWQNNNYFITLRRAKICSATNPEDANFKVKVLCKE